MPFSPSPPSSPLLAEIQSLCAEVHGAANRIILELDGRPVQCPQQHLPRQQSNPHPQRLIHTPALMGQALRRGLRHLAVGAAKLAQLCRLFVELRRTGGLTEAEQKEVGTGSVVVRTPTNIASANVVMGYLNARAGVRIVIKKHLRATQISTPLIVTTQQNIWSLQVVCNPSGTTWSYRGST